MRLTAVLLAAALLAVTLVHGLPAAQRDVIVGAETIELAEATTANGEMFTTKLHRVEELVKSDNQYYYADNQNSVNNGVRDVSVVVVLNVQDDGTLLINGMPAPMGRSTQKIDAVVVQTGADDLNRNVQVTLDVAVRVVEQQTPIGFGKMYTIEEHITELDGDRVFETSMRQWTVEVTEDGKDVKYGMAVARFNDMLPVRVPIEGIDETRVDVEEGKHHGGKHHGGKHHGGWRHDEVDHDDDHEDEDDDNMVVAPLGEDGVPPPPPQAGARRCTWFRRMAHRLRRTLHYAHAQFDRLPLVLRLILAFAFGAFTGYIILKTLTCIAGGRCCKGCNKNSGTYDANLQAYALQYTAVPTDEKDKLKKEKEAEATEAVLV